MTRLPRLLAPAAILLWSVLYVAPALRPGRILLPVDLLTDLGAWKPVASERRPVSNRLLSDTMLQFRPWSLFARESLRRGAIPWTNPHQGGGEPFVANPQTALLSPFTWITILFPECGWALAALLRLFVGGLGARRLAMTLGASERAAVVSGLVYAGSGYVVVWALYPHANVSAFLPWLAAALLRLVHEPSPLHVAACVAFAALATAGGHPESLFFGTVAIAAFVIGEAFRDGAVQVRRPARLALAGGSAACGFLLLALVVVPFLFLLAGSEARRVRVTREGEPFRVVAAVSQVVPGFLGAPLSGEIDLSLLHRRAENFNERTGTYVGALVFLALLLTFRRLEPPFRRSLVIAGVALLAAWRAPPLDWILRSLPLFSMAVCERIPGVFVLFASTAAGPALEAVAKAQPMRRLGPAVLAVGLALVVLGAAPTVSASRPVLRRAAVAGVERLRAGGALPHSTAVYEARLESYLAGGTWTALRRLALPGLAFALAGAALLSARRRSLFTLAALGELLAFGIGYLPSPHRTAEPGPPPVILDLMRRDPAGAYAFASTDALFPPDLATAYGLRDIAAYDALEASPTTKLLQESGFDAKALTFRVPMRDASVARLAGGGVRWFLSREPVSGANRVGGDPPPGVGLWERADAAPLPSAPDVPPRGFKAGAALSLAALLSVPLLLRVSRSLARPRATPL